MRRLVTERRLTCAAGGCWLLGLLVWLAFWVAVIYVVMHFVLKY